MNELIQKWSKKLAIKKSLVIILLHNLCLVIIGLKNAYLIDICMIDIDLLMEFISHINHMIFENYETKHLLIVAYDSDLFIINQTLLFNYQYETLGHIIDLDTNPITVINNESLREIEMIISSFVNNIRSNLPILQEDNKIPLIEINATSHTMIYELGGPFLAGFLLGYPMIYLARNIDHTNDYAIPSSKLSYAMLHHTIVCLNYYPNNKLLLNQFFSQYISNPYQWLEFSYPSDTLLNNPMIQKLFEDKLHWFQQSLQSRIQSINLEYQTILKLQSIEFKTNLLATQSISL